MQTEPSLPPPVLTRRPESWWTDPLWLIVAVVTPGALLPYLVPRSVFVDVWATDKFLGPHSFTAVSGCLLAIIVGALLARLREPGIPRVTRFPLEWAPRLLTLIVVAYVIWGVVGISRGLALSDILSVMRGSSEYTVIKGPLTPIGGVSTVTQLTPLVVGMYVLRVKLGYAHSTRPLILLGLLAVVRALLYAERLALLEFIVPAVIVAGAVTCKPTSSAVTHSANGLFRRQAWRWMPLASPLVVLGVFGFFESLRSWASTYSTQGTSFGSFVVTRFLGYYATAANNSVILTEGVPRTGVPYYSIQWLWDFPGISQFVTYEYVASAPRPDTAWLNLLGRVGNPEFNSPGGVLTIVWDIGVAPAAILFLILGFVSSRCYQRLKAGDMASVVLLGILVLALLELPRFFYLGQGRAFPSLVAWLLLSSLGKAEANRARRTCRTG